MNLISNALYWISTGLLVPVVVLLIFFFIRALILIGALFSQYMQQRRVVSGLLDRVAALTPASLPEFASSLPAHPDSLAGVYVRRLIEARGNEARIDLLLSDYELESDKHISTSRILTKMGPILGLMGTLIPMGPALVGLATGDIASMAYNMQVAFATTVVGLVVSAIGFLTQQVRERWAVRTLSVLEYLADLVRPAAVESEMQQP